MNNFKTLLFCTSFSNSETLWRNRYLKWLKFYNSINLNADKILMIDDGSPIIPNIESVPIMNPNEISCDSDKYKNSIIHFSENLGRSATQDYPGWFRSFSFAGKYAKKFNFEKIIHIESDVFLLSDRITNFINSLTSGWTSFPCRRYGFPESGIQIICKDQLDNFYNFCNQEYDLYRGYAIETILPLTNINHEFIGDRYGEYLSSPPENVDYCSQFLPEWNI
jgi:hypothetical protein